MTPEIIKWIGYGTVAYYVILQVYMFALALLSGYVLRRTYHTRRFGRVNEMLSSQTSPPISILIPAYNEVAGIVDSVRSISIVGYPRFEIVVTNDGSTDGTLEALIAAFRLEKVRIPYRPDIETARIRAFYRGRGAVDITVIDKENGGRADALNAAINAARYPYVLCTDADVVMDAAALVRGMQRVVEDRERTIGVGGNIRPLNGSRVELGHLISASVPRRMIPRMQVLEYMRTFLASRPGWSAMSALPLVSGAFGIWKRSALLEVGGYKRGHLGEDLDITMRLHRHHRDKGIPYRIVYESSAVLWTEVPDNVRVLRRQRIRWHRGLMTATRDFLPMTFNPRYGALGMVTWAGFFLFEFLAPLLEVTGWVMLPLAYALGALNTETVVLMLLLALGAGLMNSLVALWLDEPYGFYTGPEDTSRLIVIAMIESFGLRQMTVLWRIRAVFGGKRTRHWGQMERKGVANLGASGLSRK
jgi:cellulose synthase/poly-beta-1,6-N-acetylglucosamine synthase-like glycosyltransferase